MSSDSLFPDNFGLQDADSLFPQGSSFPSFPFSANDGTSTLPYIDKYISQNAASFTFTSINARYIIDNYFVGAKSETKNNITFVKEDKCKTDIIPKEFDLFINRDTTKGYQANGKDEYIAKIYVYASTNADKLSHLYQSSENGIKEDEILFFLEDNTGDFSNQTLYARFGSEKIKNKLLEADSKSLENISKLVPGFSNDLLKELIRNGKIEAKSSILQAILKGGLWVGMIVYAIPKAIGWIVSQIGEIIADNLKIPEKIWDSHSEEYFLKKDNLIKDLQIDTSFLKSLDILFVNSDSYKLLTFLPLGQQIVSSHIDLVGHFVNEYNSFVEEAVNNVYEEAEKIIGTANQIFYLSEGIAFFCGIWNGLIDFIADLFKFVGLILETPFDLAYNFEEFLEATDTFRENLKNFSFKDFLITAFLLKLEIDIKIYEFFKSENPREEYNFDKIAYFTGYGIAFIASLFIPITSISKIKKFVPNDFIEAINLVGNKTIKGSKAFITFIREIGELLSKKGRYLFDELKKIIDNIVAWFKRNQDVFKQNRITRVINAGSNYLRRYVGKDLQPLVRQSKAFSLYGKAGRNVVKAVDEEVTWLLQNQSKKKRDKYVMVSGMVYRKGRKVSKVHTKTNFLPEEIGKFNEKTARYLDDLEKDSVYQQFLDNMHPTLRSRYEIHLEEMAKGLNASADDIARAGKPASHGEIRALDDLLKEIDPKAILGDDVFKEILGYNRFLRKEGIQPPCTHCFYLTDFVTYIGL